MRNHARNVEGRHVPGRPRHSPPCLSALGSGRRCNTSLPRLAENVPALAGALTHWALAPSLCTSHYRCAGSSIGRPSSLRNGTCPVVGKDPSHEARPMRQPARSALMAAAILLAACQEPSSPTQPTSAGPTPDLLAAPCARCLIPV